MAQLVFFSGTMDCGKSTLALQLDYNHTARGRRGLVFTRNDRSGTDTLSSRLGLRAPAIEVLESTDFWSLVEARSRSEGHLDYLVCDEAQFYRPEQIEQLARVVDDLGTDVFTFGILSDFRTTLFPGSQRLVELADRVETLQVQTICWCGARATHNARTLDGVMVTTGAQVLIGDTRRAVSVGYEVLCRKHHMQGKTATAGPRER